MAVKENHPTAEKAAEKAAPCEVSFMVGDKAFAGTSVHFNEGGMLILCQQPAQLYSRLKLALKFPGFKSPMKVNGEVVWTNAHGPADSLSPRGMGVKFLNLDRDTERLLGDLARSYEAYGTNYHCYFT